MIKNAPIFKAIVPFILLMTTFGWSFFNHFHQTTTTKTSTGISFPTLAASDSVGEINGSFFVDAHGTGNYQINIEVPPGINGVQPHLSLAYNSQKRNGVMGVGWSLSGLSTIRRVGRSIATDGVKGGVNLDSLDRFAIDGMRLIAYKDKDKKLLDTQEKRNAAYGKDGTMYKTIIDQGSTIISHGDCNTGNCYFEVTAKNGTRSKYLDSGNYTTGNLSNSKYSSIGTIALKNRGIKISYEWNIITVMDLNSLKVFAEYNVRNNVNYPIRITYGISDLDNSPSPRFIEIAWEGRPDPVVGYINGRKLTSDLRISQIRSIVQGNPMPMGVVSTYRLSYRKSNTTGESLLTKVTVCDGNEHCLPPTTFEYAEDKAWDGTFNIITPGKNQKNDPYQVLLKAERFLKESSIVCRDFQGDGQSDLLLTSINIDIVDGGPVPYSSDSFQIFYDFHVKDYPATMKDPPFFITNNDNFNPKGINAKKNGFFDVFLPGDYNGDGKADFISTIYKANDNKKNFQLFTSIGDGRFQVDIPTDSIYQVRLRSEKDGRAVLLPIEFNGDGRSDFWTLLTGKRADSIQQKYMVYVSKGDSSFDTLPFFENRFVKGEEFLLMHGLEDQNILPADFNGDGLTDFIFQGGTNVPVQHNYMLDNVLIYLSKASGVYELFKPGSNVDGDPYQDYLALNGIPGDTDIILGDYNGDGKTDFLVPRLGDKRQFAVFISKGNADFDIIIPKGKEYQEYFKTLTGDGVIIITGDFNGDGATDFIRQESGLLDDDLIGSFMIYISQKNGYFKVLKPGKEVANDPYQDLLRKKLDIDLYVGDFDGDGVSDFMRWKKYTDEEDKPTPTCQFFISSKIDINDKRVFPANNRLTSVVTGTGKITDISYQPLTNDSIYSQGTETLEYPYRHAQSPSYVVSEHCVREGKKSEGGAQFCFSQQYQDAQVNNTRGWLGFKHTVQTDQQRKIKTVSTYYNRFPYMGKLKERVLLSTTNAKDTLGRMIYTYKAYNLDSIGIYRVNQSDYRLRHYSEGVFNYELNKQYTYNPAGTKLLRIANYGDINNPDDDIFTHFRYEDGVVSAPWREYFLWSTKTTKKANNRWDRWDEGNDLKWKNFFYDNRMNIISESVYMDSCGTAGKYQNCTPGFISESTVYNQFGLPSKITKSGLSIEKITYGNKSFPSFPTSIAYQDISQKLLLANEEHQVTMEWDPRFGRMISKKGIDGHYIFKIPDNGMNGFGGVLKTEEQHPTKDITILTDQLVTDTLKGGGILIKEYRRKDWIVNDTAQWLRTTQYIDALGRTYKTETKGYNNETKLVERVSFNEAGLMDKNYLPYFENATKGIHYSPNGQSGITPQYYEQKYGIHGRFKQLISPGDSLGAPSYVETEVDYQLHNDRAIWFKTPNPDSLSAANGHPDIWYLQQKDTYGHTLLKAGPFLTQDTNQHIHYAAPFNSIQIDSRSNYSYDKLGRLTSVTGPLGQKSTSRYNSLGAVIYNYQKETGVELFYYDEWGRLSKDVDANGNQHNYTYDQLSRVTSKESINSSGNKKLVHLHYDTLDGSKDPNLSGRLSRVISPEGSYTFKYDNRGNLIEKRTQIKSLGEEVFIFRYVYDALDRITQITYPDKTIVQYQFDRPDGKLTAIMTAQGVEGKSSGYGFKPVAGFNEYDANGAIGKITYANDVTTNHTYDVLGRPASTKTNKGTYVHEQIAYRWSKANKLIGISDLRKEKEGLSRTGTFHYDVAGRLHREDFYEYSAREDKDHTIFISEKNARNYHYDPAGNLLNYSSLDLSDRESGTDYTATYVNNPDAKHQPQELKVTFDSDPVGTISIKYDLAGNLSEMGSWNYKYDSDGFLTKSSLKTKRKKRTLNNFSYDAFGRRINKTDYVYNDKNRLEHQLNTWYVSDLYLVYEDTVNQDIKKAQTRYISGPEGVISMKSQLYNNHSLLNEGDELGLSFYTSASDITPGWIYSLILQVLIYGSGLLLLLWIIFECYKGRKRSIRWLKQKTLIFSSLSLSSTPLVKREYKRYCFLKINSRLSYRIIVGILTWSFWILGVLPTQAQSKSGLKLKAGDVYFHLDHLGGTAFVTGSTGAKFNSYQYAPFGDATNPTQVKDKERLEVRPTFTGKEYDEASKLYYFDARYLSNNALKRFISPDPAGQYHSPYVYGFDDPMSGVDPDGEAWQFILIAVVIGVVIGAYIGGSMANGSFNPGDWNWSSSDTWVGMAAGAIVGGALGAAGALPESVAVGGMSAASIAGITADVTFLAWDGYTFARHPNPENGIFLALDLIPFIGPLIGKGTKAFKVARGLMRGEHEFQEAARATEKIAQNPAHFEHVSCPYSFPEGTEIQTKDGLKDIEDIEVGDEVLGYDEENGETAYYPVSHTFTREVPQLIEISLHGDTILTTSEHPFYTKNKGWVEAQDLKVCDQLLDQEGGEVVILDIRKIQEVTQVYNFEVQGVHNYFVSEEGVLVHNPRCGGLARSKLVKNNTKREVITAQLHESGGHTGTATNQAARTHVNAKSTPVPVRYKAKFTYLLNGKTHTIRTHYKQSKWIDNPHVPGQDWDAGHIVGQQNGGTGIAYDNLFPQTKQINRGNSLFGNKTFEQWRRFENNVRKALKESKTGHFTMKLEY